MTRIIKCTQPDGSVLFTDQGCDHDRAKALITQENAFPENTSINLSGIEAGLAGIDLMVLIPAVYLLASLASFSLYGFDKKCASAGKRRVAENTLHFFDLLGGWPGGFLAQQKFRHKTRKVSFRVAYWATVVANLFLVAVVSGGLPLAGFVV